MSIACAKHGSFVEISQAPCWHLLCQTGDRPQRLWSSGPRLSRNGSNAPRGNDEAMAFPQKKRELFELLDIYYPQLKSSPL